MSEIPSILVMGAAASGRSALVDAVRTEEFYPDVFIPLILTTRPDRLTDNPEEIQHMEPEEFESELSEGLLEYDWSREKDIGGRNVRYAFQSRREAGLGIYLVSLAFSHSLGIKIEKHEPKQRLFNESLRVLTAAAREVRERRLRQNFPGMPDQQRNFLLDEPYRNGFELDGSELIIASDDKDISLAQDKFKQVVRGVLEYNQAVREEKYLGTLHEFKRLS
jgi:hypothetical protein